MLIKPIQAIVSFDLKGNMLPLYLKIDDVRLKVESSKLSKEMYGMKTYTCTVIDSNYRKNVQIVYKVNETMWYLSDGRDNF